MIQTILKILIIILSLHKDNTDEQPVRLDPKKPKTSLTKKIKKELHNIDWKVIIFIIIVMLIFLISSIIIFKTGSMESTQLYNNRLIE